MGALGRAPVCAHVSMAVGQGPPPPAGNSVSTVLLGSECLGRHPLASRPGPAQDQEGFSGFGEEMFLARKGTLAPPNPSVHPGSHRALSGLQGGGVGGEGDWTGCTRLPPRLPLPLAVLSGTLGGTLACPAA